MRYELFSCFAGVFLILMVTLLIATQYFSIAPGVSTLAPVVLMLTLTPLQFRLIKSRELIFADQIVVRRGLASLRTEAALSGSSSQGLRGTADVSKLSKCIKVLIKAVRYDNAAQATE